MYPRNRWWRNRLKKALGNGYLDNIHDFIDKQTGKGKIIYPEESQWFRALDLCPGNNVKAVILGQDPFYNGTADGLAFSSTVMTPSLRNIFRCLKSDLGIVNENPSLEPWAKQGILLLNTVFTVEEYKPLSHKGIGWERVTDAIISILANEKRPIAWCLWGNEAKSKKALIKSAKCDIIISSSHPSPLSCYKGFLFHKPFSRINKFCEKMKYKKIDWRT